MNRTPVLASRTRQFFAAVLLPIFGIAATGCGTAATSALATPPQVRIWRLNQPLDPLRGPLAGFIKVNPTVQVTYKEKQINGYEADALKSMASKNGPDIWSIPDDWVGDEESVVQAVPANYYYSTDGTSTPSPAEEVRKIFPVGIANQIIEPSGQVDGIPTNVDSLQLYYNPSIFQQALQDFVKNLGNNQPDSVVAPVRDLLKNAPQTWNDLVDQSKYLTSLDSSGNIVRSAIAMGTADNIPNSEEILQLLMMQNGSQIVSSDRTSALFHVPITTAAGVQVNPGAKALEFYTSFATPGKANYSWNPSMPSALDAFAQGKVAMVIAFSDFGAQLKIKYPRFDNQVTAVPQIALPTVQAPVNFIKFSLETVTKTADNTAAAFAALRRYSNSDDTQALASEQHLRSPYVITLKRNTDDYLNQQILTGQAVFKVQRASFDDAFRQMIVDTSQNGVPPTDAVNAGAQKINALLQPPVTPLP